MAIAKKKFFSVELPLIKEDVSLLGTSLEDLDKRRIKIDLTRALRGRSLEAVFEIKTEKDKVFAEAKKLSLFGFYIRRAIRNATDYVEDSFLAETNDKMLRIKPFLITRKKVSRRVRKALRDECKNYLANYIKTKETEEILKELISGKLTKALSLRLKKIYPLAFCDIRCLEIVGDIERKEEVEKIN